MMPIKIGRGDERVYFDFDLDRVPKSLRDHRKVCCKPIEHAGVAKPAKTPMHSIATKTFVRAPRARLSLCRGAQRYRLGLDAGLASKALRFSPRRRHSSPGRGGNRRRPARRMTMDRIASSQSYRNAHGLAVIPRRIHWSSASPRTNSKTVLRHLPLRIRGKASASSKPSLVARNVCAVRSGSGDGPSASSPRPSKK